LHPNFLSKLYHFLPKSDVFFGKAAELQIHSLRRGLQRSRSGLPRHVAAFAWFAWFAVQFERTHVRCYSFKYLKSGKGGVAASRLYAASPQRDKSTPYVVGYNLWRFTFPLPKLYRI